MTNDETPRGISEGLWRRAILTADVHVESAIRNLDLLGIKIILIVGADGALIGTVSDGDIRRGLLRGLGLGSSIDTVINRNPLVVPPDMDRDLVLQLMVANKVQQIPVVDEQRRVVGLHFWDEINATPNRLNPMVIMAGGRGSRLNRRTNDCPKPLLPIAGKPILEHIIERAKLEGFGNFVITTHYLGEMIKEYFGDGARHQVNICYTSEDSPLGTAGALSLLDPRPELPFIVTNGDVITNIKYGDVLDFHTRNHAVGTMAVLEHEWQHPFGIVHTKGVTITGFEEKPVFKSHINAGVYALEPSALDYLEGNAKCDMPALFAKLQEKSQTTIAFPMHEPWLDVGRPSDFENADEVLSS